MTDAAETILLTEQALTALCGGYNLVYFARYWRHLGLGQGMKRSGEDKSQEPAGWEQGVTRSVRGRRVATAVLVLTNLAFLVLGVGPMAADSFPLDAGGSSTETQIGAFPMAAAAAMTLLIRRSRTRR